MTLGKWNLTQRGEMRINGMRFCAIHISTQRGETLAARATTGFVTSAEASAAAPVAGADSPRSSLFWLVNTREFSHARALRSWLLSVLLRNL